MLKQKAQKLERKWQTCISYCLAWKDCLVAIEKGFHKTRIAPYTSLIEENRNNSRFLFSTVAKLNTTSVLDPHVASTVEDF